jgi:DNA replication protein DnaC
MKMNLFFANLEAQANANIKAEQGDYEVDGLLMCGKCHTPKQCRVEVLGTIRKPRCLCKCMQEARAREEAERKQQEFERRVRDLRRAAFPYANMAQWTFANDDGTNERLTSIMRKYVEAFPTARQEGKGLLLYGDVGTGKTYAACEVANALIDCGYPVLVTNFAKILNELQGTFNKQEYIDSFNYYPLLVVDDLGIERDTAFAKEQVYNVIDARYRANLPIIYTTNTSLEAIKHPKDIVDQRIYDRVLEKSIPVEVKGQSRRVKKIVETYGDWKERLGL